MRLDRASVTNTGSDGVSVTVTVTDSSNNVVADAPVTVSADAGAIVIAASRTTDATGKMTADVIAGPDDRSNRTVTLTATSGSVSRSATFQVTGATLKSTAVGSSVLTPGATAQISYQLVDVNAVAMARQAITVTAPSGTTEGTTDVTGTYIYTWTAPATTGTYVIKATSAGAAAADVTFQVVTAASAPPSPAPNSILSGSVEANPSVVAINTGSTNPPNSATVRARFSGLNNAPVPNVRVRFDLAGDTNSIGGTFSSGSNIVYANSLGEATTLYMPDARSSPTEGVTIRACYGYTDAEVANGACANSVVTKLTVASQAISITIGTNKLLIDNSLTYIQEFVVTVVDSSGRAKSDVQITPSIDLLRYGKGQWGRVGGVWVLAAPQYFYDATRTPWYLEDPRSDAEKAAGGAVPPISANAACWNEDRNRNGVKEDAEDAVGSYSILAGGNGNGRLDPSKSDVAISPKGSSVTDSTGKMVLRIEYPKNLAGWIEYKILVAASGVFGTEGRATWTDVLGIPVAALKEEAEPPFSVSRYGILAGCTNDR